MMEMEHDEKIICECDGFTVRGWRGADVAQLAEAANDESVGRFLRDSFPYPYEEQDARRFIAVAAMRRPLWDFAIEVDGRVAGGIGFVPQDDVERFSVEMGCWLAPGYRGRGMMCEAVRRAAEYLFARRGVVRIFANVMMRNVASQRMLERAGFRRAGVMRRMFFKNGMFDDGVCYELVRE